ncbi:MAG TPA: ABC transporter ATP-binding protein [Chloroflexota bacterium]|nr:ABC transporter ATP-binding protein [Chloroflexota bacterium]
MAAVDTRVRSRETPDAGRPLLSVHELTVDYLTPRGPARAVDHVSFTIGPGEILGLAGESGCGKSTAAHAIMRLIKPPGRITTGVVRFRDRDVMLMSERELLDFRWRQVSIVFQSAMNALNPVLSIGAQISDAIRAHTRTSRRQAWERATELFELVGIDTGRLHSFPHQLSGGMRQRAVIAMALALNPDLIILDEPTTALDVVVQRDILQQIEELQARLGFSILFITHDLSLLVEVSTRIAVMYAGKIVESATARDLFDEPLHPYTVGLMESFPSITGPKERLEGIPGAPPDLITPPRGCRFHPRCPQCSLARPDLYQLQTEVEPVLREVRPGHWVACHLY